MAGEILLTPENLMSEASNLLNYKSALDDIFNQIANLIAGFVSHWHGETQTAFADSFNQKRAVFDKFSQDMASFADFMKTYAISMQDTEKGNANRARSLGGA